VAQSPAILGMDRVEEDELDEEVRTTAPRLEDWIETWLTLKVDVADSTHKEYARMLRERVVPELGKFYVDEIDREKDVDPWKVNLSAALMPAGVQKHSAVLSMVMRDTVPRYRADNPLDRPLGHRSNGLPKIYKYNACFLGSSKLSGVEVSAVTAGGGGTSA